MIEKFFFELIRVALGNAEGLSHNPTDKVWWQMYYMAKKQGLIGICFAAVQRLPEEKRPPEILYFTWMGMAAKIQQRNEIMNNYTNKTLEYFRSNGFPCCILKGQGLASEYGTLASLRQSGDIDVWVSCSRKELYKFSKMELGKITGLTFHHIHYDMYRDVEIEAHIWPAFFTFPVHNQRFQKFCKTYSPTEDCEVFPSTAFNRVFILQHCFGHFCGRGIGLRQLLDYYFVLMQGCTEQERIESLTWIQKLGMSQFAEALMWVCVEVFGMNKAVCICKQNEKYGRFLLAEVMQTGNMGHQDDRFDHKILQSAFGRYVHNLKRDLQIMRIAPVHAIWEPLWGICQFTWCKIIKIIFSI